LELRSTNRQSLRHIDIRNSFCVEVRKNYGLGGFTCMFFPVPKAKKKREWDKLIWKFLQKKLIIIF